MSDGVITALLSFAGTITVASITGLAKAVVEINNTSEYIKEQKKLCEKQREEVSTNKEMVNGIALNEMSKIYNRCKEHGITELDRIRFYDLFKKYIANGGNSYAEDLEEKFSKLE